MESIINKNEIKNIENFFYKNGWKPLPYQIESWKAYLNGENGMKQVITLGAPVLKIRCRICLSVFSRIWLIIKSISFCQ
mgnify:CR=1 FL=1